MENRHVTQALQEILADLPPEDQALKILSFTEKIEALEAAEPAEPEKPVDSDVQQGWEDIGGYEADKDPALRKGRRQKGGKGARVAARESKGLRLAVLFVPVVLALIEAAVIVALLISGGGRTAEPDTSDQAINGPDIESAGSAETNTGTADASNTEQDAAQPPAPEITEPPESDGSLDSEASEDEQMNQEQNADPEQNANPEPVANTDEEAGGEQG